MSRIPARHSHSTAARDAFAAFVLMAICILVAALLAGCATPFRSAGVPSDQRTAIAVNAETVRMLTDSGVVNARILAESLSAVQDQGSVVYVDHHGWVYGPDGNPYLLANGMPIKLRTTIITKLNSLHAIAEIQGVDDLDYEVGGHSYMEHLPEHLRHISVAPVALRMRLHGLGSAGSSSPLPEIIAARAAERDAILSGLTAETRERYIGRGLVIEAVSDGLVRVIDQAGRTTTGVLKSITPVEGAAGVAESLIVTLADARSGSVDQRTVAPPD